MISVTEEISLLTKQENQLHTSLDNLRGQRSLVKEHKQVEKELAAVQLKRQTLQAWAVFKVGMPVHRLNSNRFGIVKKLKVTPGGMGIVWVSWNGTIQTPEQPNLLQIDEAALEKIIAVGDRVIIVGNRIESGETFTVGRLLARGAIETTDKQIFEREEWLLIEGVFQEIVETANKEDENLTHRASCIQEHKWLLNQ